MHWETLILALKSFLCQHLAMCCFPLLWVSESRAGSDTHRTSVSLTNTVHVGQANGGGGENTRGDWAKKDSLYRKIGDPTKTYTQHILNPTKKHMFQVFRAQQTPNFHKNCHFFLHEYLCKIEIFKFLGLFHFEAWEVPIQENASKWRYFFRLKIS